MRAIDADAFVRKIRKQYCEDCVRRKGIKNGKMQYLYEIGGAPCRACEIEDMLNEVEDAPPIQPEIVRCKDCKYAEYIDDVQTLWCTECGQGRTVAPNDFCSYAERREVNNESN